MEDFFTSELQNHNDPSSLWTKDDYKKWIEEEEEEDIIEEKTSVENTKTLQQILSIQSKMTDNLSNSMDKLTNKELQSICGEKGLKNGK